jgi:hypothetical protein
MAEDEAAALDELISSGHLLAEETPLRYRAQKARLLEKVASFEGFRLLCHIGEFSALLKKSLKESSSGLTEAIIDAYDNPDKLDNPTRTSPLSAPKPSVSVLTTTTTGRLLRHLMKEETEGGFANRFVYFGGDRKAPNPLPPEPRYDHLNQVVQGIVQARRRWHNTQFQLLEPTQEVWDNYYHEWYYQLDDDVIDPITGRLPDNTMKLALQYALLENAAPEILPEQMKAAVTVARYWHETIRVLFQNYGMTESQKTEHEILKAVSNGGKSKEELYHHFSRNIDARTLNLALYNLQQIGRIAPERKSNGPGRPKVVFRLKENIGKR